MAVLCIFLVIYSLPHSATSTTACLESIRNQRSLLISAYSESLKGVTHVALLDFPYHANSGDSAIWLGEVSLLEALGIEIVYICALRDCEIADIETALSPYPNSHVAIMLHGGGNFGDLWNVHQEHRNRVLAEQPNRRIRAFPQTFGFNMEKPTPMFRATQAAIAAHHDVELVVRDAMSYKWCLESFPGTPVKLLPDAAFMIGHNATSTLTPPIMRPPHADHSILSLPAPYGMDFPFTSSALANPFHWPVISWATEPQSDVLILAPSRRRRWPRCSRPRLMERSRALRHSGGRLGGRVEETSSYDQSYTWYHRIRAQLSRSLEPACPFAGTMGNGAAQLEQSAHLGSLTHPYHGNVIGTGSRCS